MAKKKLSPNNFIRERKIGDHEIVLPKPPPVKDIDGHDLPIKKQRFVPVEIPNDLENRSQEEQREFIFREMDRRKNGYWFYNNGNIEYMTGAHYFYCNYWKLDVGLPKWRETDRDFYYLVDYAEKSDSIHGVLFIAQRRQGKTYKAISYLYDSITRKKNAHCGIQSKTNTDAKKIFGKLVFGWRKMPYFWRPTDSGETNPKSALRFEEPSSRAKENRGKYKEVLDSYVDYAPSNEEAYDGTKQYRYYGDEVGKKSDADIRERWYVVKPCLETGDDIVGKALLTSTVEDMESGGGACYKLWKESDVTNPDMVDDNGRTVSGLIRYFQPAYLGFEGYIDEYGYSIVEDPEKPTKNEKGKEVVIGAKTFLLNKRRNLQNDLLIKEKRKYPFSPSEAFMMDSDESPFPVHKIQEQIEYNEKIGSHNYVRRGNFIWVEKYKSVEFVDDPKGFCRVSWMPHHEDRNKMFYKNRKWHPENSTTMKGGVDPFDHNYVADKRRSDGSVHIFRKFNGLDPYNSNCFVCHYLGRPELASMFYEDVLKIAIFYGSELLIENNKIGIINYFRENGFEGFLMKRPDSTKYSTKRGKVEYGIPMSGEHARTDLVDTLSSYIYHYVGVLNLEKLGIYDVDDVVYSRNYFSETLEDWMNFDMYKWTEFDSAVSSGLALMAAKKKDPIIVKTKTIRKPIFKKYKL